MAAQNGIQLLFLIRLMLTFVVNHQDLVVWENFTARLYANPEIKIQQIYLVKTKITSNTMWRKKREINNVYRSISVIVISVSVCISNSGR